MVIELMSEGIDNVGILTFSLTFFLNKKYKMAGSLRKILFN